MNPWVIDYGEMTLRLALALVLGGVIGLEREKSNRAAGFRTNILVCLGSCLIMLLSMYGFSAFADEPNVRMDPARLAAQVISGIGFLGAGVIIFNGFSITGLTTAASLWVVAAIGLAVGAGYYYPASVTTFLVLFSLLILNKIEKKWIRAKKVYLIELAAEEGRNILAQTMDYLESMNIEVLHFSVQHAENKTLASSGMTRVKMTVKLPESRPITAITHDLARTEGLREIRVGMTGDPARIDKTIAANVK